MSPTDYQELIERIHERVRSVVPPAATVLIVSKGDNKLIELDSRHGWHFPRESDGTYSGYHPADSHDAISRMEKLRDEGADYLVFPSTSYWWLDYYEGFRRHLHGRYRLLSSDGDCEIFHLIGSQAVETDTEVMVAKPRQDQTWQQAAISRLVDGLLPGGTVTALLSSGSATDGAPNGCRLWRLDEEVLSSDQKATVALRELATGDAEFLVIPRSAFDWIEQNPALEEALRKEHQLVTRQACVCAIFKLEETAQAAAPRRGFRSRLLAAFGRVG